VRGGRPAYLQPTGRSEVVEIDVPYHQSEELEAGAVAVAERPKMTVTVVEVQPHVV
jgi:hypothetical protein